MYQKSKLDYFLNTNLQNKKIIVIYGPTASWKTDLSIKIAKYIDSEIISCDSRQIFKYLNIWTAKIKEEEKQGITHHMIDIIEPNIEYSLWLYKMDSINIINDLHLRWKIPILCWWTWLYIDSLLFDFDIPKIPANKELRRSLEIDASLYWNDYIYKKLLEIDPIYASYLHPNNITYIIRWIEIKIMTWKSKLDFFSEKSLKYDSLFLSPYDDNFRQDLYYRIDKRVDLMIDNWLEKEIYNIFDLWFKKSDFWLKTIWYKEYISYLDWEISFELMKDSIKQNSRNYAKRQITWFRKYNNFIT